MPRCIDCQDGEHDNYSDDVHRVVVREPEDRRVVRAGYMCSDHCLMYADDGYIVTYSETHCEEGN